MAIQIRELVKSISMISHKGLAEVLEDISIARENLPSVLLRDGDKVVVIGNVGIFTNKRGGYEIGVEIIPDREIESLIVPVDILLNLE